MGKNFVGRSQSMDVILVDDKKISRDKHCSIIFDPKSNEFYVAAEGGNLVYLNNQMLEGSAKLEQEDVITIGDTSLMFIPFCREVRQWEKES
jgi:predicted component of type VI protein secretion system